MSNLQQFRQAFAVNFPVEIADQILGHMQALYGDLFDKKYGEVDSEHLKTTVCQVLNGLSPEDLNRGIQRMSTEKWCPTLPEFRGWCIHDDEWWTAEMAWAFSLNWKKDNSKPISKLAKRTLGEVSEILNTQGQRAAHRAFIDTYEHNLRQAKKLNCVQVMWIKPDRTNNEDCQKKFEEKKAERLRTEKLRSPSPMPSELAAQAKMIYKRAGKAI